MAYTSSATSYGIELSGVSHCTIAGCYIHNVGYWNNDGSVVPSGAGIHIAMPVNCLITGCEVTRTGLQGIAVDGAQNCIISHNNVHDYITWGIDVGGDYQLCTGNDICDDTVHDLYYFDAGFWGGADGPPHTDYVFIRMGSGQHPVSNIVERNLFYNDRSFAEFGGTAMVFLSYADSTIIRNNIFINPHEYYAAYFGWTSAGTKFYNNTIYAPRTGGCRLQTNGHSNIRDNIFVVAGEALTSSSDTDRIDFTCDYNLYSVGSSPSDAFDQVAPYAAWTFTSWKSMGYDVHSQQLSGTTAFKFNNVIGYPAASETMDLRVSAGSPAIGSGTSVSCDSVDFDSVSRPAGSVWDIGAYRYLTTAVMNRAQAGMAPEKSLPTLWARDRLNTLLGNGDYRLFDCAGRARTAGQARSNMVYILKDITAGTACRIMVIR